MELTANMCPGSRLLGVICHFQVCRKKPTIWLGFLSRSSQLYSEWLYAPSWADSLGGAAFLGCDGYDVIRFLLGIFSAGFGGFGQSPQLKREKKTDSLEWRLDLAGTV